jgi:hypothetical protein
LKVAGIEDLSVIPNTCLPEHADVKSILMIYSLECFLFKRMNQASRDKDSSAVKTLGPYAVAISKIIDSVEFNRRDKIQGKFVCYRGFVLPSKVIKKWMK